MSEKWFSPASTILGIKSTLFLNIEAINKRGERKQKSCLVQQPCSHNIREVVLGASNRKLSVSCYNIPNDPQFPSQCFLLLDLWQWISYQGKDKENIQHCAVHRREAELADSGELDLLWWRIYPTSVWLYLTKLCSTFIVKTLWDIQSKCNAYSPSLGNAYFVCAVNTE